MQIANVRVMNYDLFTDKDCSARIAMIPDFHDAKEERIKLVLEKLNEIKPDAIVMQGDTMQARKYILNSESQRRLKKTLKDASDICDIFLGLGNHDLCGMGKKELQGYRDLGKKSRKVHPLCNGTYNFKEFNIKFTEIHTSHKTYAPSKQNRGNALLLLSEEAKKIRKLEPSSKDESLNLLLYHNPKIMALAISIAAHKKFCMEQKKYEELAEISRVLSMFDAILAAHLHSGYLSITALVDYVIAHPEKVLDFGIWEMPATQNIKGFPVKINPLFFEKTNMCRGGQYISSSIDDETRIIQMPREDLSQTPRYFRAKTILTHKKKDYEELELEEALKLISDQSRTPIYVAGAVNPDFNCSFGVSEVTVLHIHGKGEIHLPKKQELIINENNDYIKQKK